MRKTLLALTILQAITSFAQQSESTRAWGDIEYKDNPWVENVSRPIKISKGLTNKHLSIWASHGRYYDQDKGFWKWQRPNLFCTTEDLFTQTIVVPYLIPMLEKAGAIVFTPRERDWQPKEIIIDNDDVRKGINYIETNVDKTWSSSQEKGFASSKNYYLDGDNPFTNGTIRTITATKHKNSSLVSYQPNIKEAGKYAVYVSYKTLPNSVSDAQYFVYHKGQRTEFRVNQRMGGSTWVYLGTFDFDKGCNNYNRVVITNNSRDKKSIVTTDAVRFGGGMGNIQRGGTTSELPRCLEGARYYAQWAGAPYQVYSGRNGTNDYADDINVRSLMTNWLAGGSVFVPNKSGLNVPIELSLALHSDAGYSIDGKTIIGNLAICTTNFNDGKLAAGISRMTSKDFAYDLLNNENRDIRAKYKKWNKRYLWDRNYSETRLPEVPSAILETMSHQSFPDMRFGQDPNFRFTLARSIYKTILKYVSNQHGDSYIVQPLAPTNFSVVFLSNEKVKLSWSAQTDFQESTATPTSYNVYTATGTSGFDNGTNVKNNSITIKLEPDIQYNFKVTACNKGGESFSTEVLSAIYRPNSTKNILVINGFHRLSSPEVIDNDSLQGFNLDADYGVNYGITCGFAGRQQEFSKSMMGIEGPGGLGYGGNELAGTFIAGNDFNYTRTHAEAIAKAGNYNVSSCSSDAILTGKIKMQDFDCIDLILGLEKYDGHALEFYKTFTPRMQQLLTDYSLKGGALLVSGSYIASDMKSSNEKTFLHKTMKLDYAPRDSTSIGSTINGLGMSFDIYTTINSRHYSVNNPDIISPIAPAICAMQYSDGNCAAIAYKGNKYNCFVMGFPFECIISTNDRAKIMKGILNYILH